MVHFAVFTIYCITETERDWFSERPAGLESRANDLLTDGPSILASLADDLFSSFNLSMASGLSLMTGCDLASRWVITAALERSNGLTVRDESIDRERPATNHFIHVETNSNTASHHEWMNEWMSMNEWMNVNESMNEWMNECQWINEWMNEWMSMNQWMNVNESMSKSNCPFECVLRN